MRRLVQIVLWMSVVASVCHGQEYVAGKVKLTNGEERSGLVKVTTLKLGVAFVSVVRCLQHCTENKKPFVTVCVLKPTRLSALYRQSSSSAKQAASTGGLLIY